MLYNRKTLNLLCKDSLTKGVEGWTGSEKGGRGALIRERGSFKERLFSLNKISPLLRMCSRRFEKKESFLEVAHINYPRHFPNTF